RTERVSGARSQAQMLAPSDALALRPELRLIGPLPGLVCGQRLRRIDIAERLVLGHDVGHARQVDPESLAEDRQDRPRLHLADARQVEQPRLEVLAVLGLAPDPRCVAVVAL